MDLSTLGMTWGQAGLVVITAVAVYATTLAASRLFGQRQFATISTHDLVFVFALGSIIGRVVLVRTSLAAAVLGLLVMFGLHAALGHLFRSGSPLARAVNNPPYVVAAHGHVLPDQLARARLGEGELRHALREKGHGSLDGLQAVVLEPNGQISALPDESTLDPTFLEGVDGARHVID